MNDDGTNIIVSQQRGDLVFGDWTSATIFVPRQVWIGEKLLHRLLRCYFRAVLGEHRPQNRQQLYSDAWLIWSAREVNRRPTCLLGPTTTSMLRNLQQQFPIGVQPIVWRLRRLQGLVHLDAPYGKEPIPLLQALAQDYGFGLKFYPVPAPQMQNQSSLWLDVRRDRLDWIYLQGWGAMNPTAVKEAIKIGFRMDRLVGVWWSGGDDDARPAGPEAKGYSSLSINGVGQNYPAIQDILKYVVDKGKSQVASKDKVGENLYNRAVLNAALIAEAIRGAQSLTGKKQVNGDDVRRGFEALSITDARWKEVGLPGFAAPIHLSCADHNGHGGISLVQWDGTEWHTTVPSIQPIKDKVLPLIESTAEEYVKANAGWPKQTESCAKSS